MMSRKTYDNMARDSFARAVGIDIGDEAAGIFDEFHRIEVDRMRLNIERMRADADEDSRAIQAQWRMIGVWKIIAAFGWGMFAIACLSRFHL